MIWAALSLRRPIGTPNEHNNVALGQDPEALARTGAGVVEVDVDIIDDDSAVGVTCDGYGDRDIVVLVGGTDGDLLVQFVGEAGSTRFVLHCG